MQDFGDVEQLKALFAKFASPVRLKVRYDDSDLGQGIHSFIQDFCQLSDKLLWEAEEAQGIPGIEIFREDGSPVGIVYHAVPGGHEFQSFLLALYNTAGPGQEQEVAGEFLRQNGNEALPRILLDGKKVLNGRFPTNDEIAQWMEVPNLPKLLEKK